MDDQRRRASRRAFIRASHPDRGGDPAEFAAGLARLERQSAPGTAPVRVVARRRLPARLLTTLARRVTRHRPPRRVR